MDTYELLEVEVRGKDESLKRAQQTVITTTADVYKLADAEKLYELRAAQSAAATAAYQQKMEQLRFSVEEYIATQIKLSDADRRAAGLAAETAPMTRQARQGFVDITRAAQDFAQGGFPAIINNLEGIGRALPAILSNPMAMLSSLPGLFTAFGVVALEVYNNWDKIKGVFQDTAPLQAAHKSLSALNKELDEHKKALAAIEKQSAVTRAEQEEYNKLLAVTADLEKKIADETERQKSLKELKELKDPLEAQNEAARIAAVKESFGGTQATQAQVTALGESFRIGAEKTLQSIFDEMNKLDFGERGSAQFRAATDRLQELRRQARIYQEQSQQGPESDAAREQYARELLAQSTQPTAKGKEAFEEIRKQMKAAPEKFTEAQIAAIEVASDEFQQNERKYDQALEDHIERVATSRKNRKQREKESQDQRELAAIEDKESEEHWQKYRQELAEQQKANIATGMKIAQDADKERAQTSRELEKALGPEFMEQARQTLGGIRKLPTPDDRSKAMMEFQDAAQRAATQRMAAGGMDPGHAAVLANSLMSLLQAQLKEQRLAGKLVTPGPGAPKHPVVRGKLPLPVAKPRTAKEYRKAKAAIGRTKSAVAAEDQRAKEAKERRDNIIDEATKNAQPRVDPKQVVAQGQAARQGLRNQQGLIQISAIYGQEIAKQAEEQLNHGRQIDAILRELAAQARNGRSNGK